ncbi:hypothetical protein ALMP_78230 [Streptomyces sp. A012304]|nr:hypothetical protein ALMP_78230 [Streptomyces sp. A012304]
MVTALSGHIDDRDGLSRRLEDLRPMCPHFPPDQPDFRSVVERITKGPTLFRRQPISRCYAGSAEVSDAANQSATTPGPIRPPRAGMVFPRIATPQML